VARSAQRWAFALAGVALVVLVALAVAVVVARRGDDAAAPGARVEACTERMLRRANNDDASRADARDYVETTYCAPFERRGWVYDDGALAIDAQLWLESSGSEVCATAGAGGAATTIPCEELDRGPKVLDCAILHLVRRREVRTYLEEFGREREVRCDDGTALEALGVP
jgi:hypothetical protein